MAAAALWSVSYELIYLVQGSLTSRPRVRLLNCITVKLPTTSPTRIQPASQPVMQLTKTLSILTVLAAASQGQTLEERSLIEAFLPRCKSVRPGWSPHRQQAQCLDTDSINNKKGPRRQQLAVRVLMEDP